MLAMEPVVIPEQPQLIAVLMHQCIRLYGFEFDNDWQPIGTADFAYVDVSVDGGATWQNVFTWNDIDVRNTHEVWDLTSLVALSNFSIRFRYNSARVGLVVGLLKIILCIICC